jgi:hypothetical protein
MNSLSSGSRENSHISIVVVILQRTFKRSQCSSNGGAIVISNYGMVLGCQSILSPSLHLPAQVGTFQPISSSLSLLVYLLSPSSCGTRPTPCHFPGSERIPCMPMSHQADANSISASLAHAPPRHTTRPHFGTKLGWGVPSQNVRTLAHKNSYTDRPCIAQVAITVQIRSLQRFPPSLRVPCVI